MVNVGWLVVGWLVVGGWWLVVGGWLVLFSIVVFEANTGGVAFMVYV